MAALVTPLRQASYDVCFQHHQDHLRAHVTGGDRGLSTTLGYWRAIANEARRLRPATLLVIGDMSGEPLPIEQLPAFFEGIAGWGMEPLRIAYVEVRGLQMSLVEMAEIHAREQGFDVHVFSNESDAAMWLRHGES